jgi:DNA polymerase-1
MDCKRDEGLTIILDGNSYCHRAGHAMFLQNDKGENVSVAFGFLRMTRSLIEKHKPKEVCVCWDAKGGSASKKALYPVYKEQRKQEVGAPFSIYQEIIKQIDEMYSILPDFGLKQIKIEGLEADDAIGLLVDILPASTQMLVVSSDRDLFQLVNEGATVYYPKDDIYLTKENFEEYFGLKPECYVYYKSLVGDSSDNIKGLEQFGEKTSTRLSRKFGPWINWFSDGNVSISVLNDLKKKQREIIMRSESYEILLRNFALIKLGLLDVNFKDEVWKEYESQKPIFDEQKIKGYLFDKQFSSILARFNAFIHPFRLLSRKE